MTIRSIKDKITSIASGEILGETNKGDKDKENKSNKSSKRKPRRSSPKNNKVKKNTSEPKGSKGSKEEQDNEATNKDVIFNPIKDSVEGYEDVLSILGIRESLDVDVDFKSNDLDYIEFSQTTPLGFDFDEVTDFISRAKYTLDKYETALRRRERDIVIIASEVKKVEQRMIEKNQERELERMIGGMTEEERLIEENMNLKIEINELKNKLISNSEGKPKVDQEMEALRAENQMLREGLVNENSQKQKGSSGLPSLSNEEKNMPHLDMPDLEDSDSVSNMIKDMGGLYDE